MDGGRFRLKKRCLKTKTHQYDVVSIASQQWMCKIERMNIWTKTIPYPSAVLIHRQGLSREPMRTFFLSNTEMYPLSTAAGRQPYHQMEVIILREQRNTEFQPECAKQLMHFPSLKGLPSKMQLKGPID